MSSASHSFFFQFSVCSIASVSWDFSWFRKIDTTGIRAQQAQTLFEHAFTRYKAAEPIPEPVTHRPTPLATSSFSSFIDDVSMADSNLDNIAPTATVSELDRYLQADTIFGRGDPNKPLSWWKVQLLVFVNLLVYTNTSYSPLLRLMNGTSLWSPGWPGISLLYQEQVFLSSISFHHHEIFAPRCIHP